MRFLIFDIESYKDFFSVVAKFKGEDKRIIATSDNPEPLQHLINMMSVKDIVFTGFNIKGFDLPVLSTMLREYQRLGKDRIEYVVSKVYETAQNIISGNNARFDYKMCTFTDLQDDTQQGVSLKTYESNKGRAIEETKVPFDTPKTTKLQRELIVRYNCEDVDATENLLEERWEYVMTKINIANKFRLDPYMALKKTIAGLSANVLIKNPYKKDKSFLTAPIRYELHEKIKDYVESTLPPWLVKKFTDYKADVGLKDRDFVLFDNYVTIGEGGAHSVHIKNDTKPNHVLTASPKKGKILCIIDISSYYPNTVIQFGYQSRMVDDPKVFESLIDEKNKLSPIAKGPNSTKEVKDALTAVKALINATVGAFKQPNNSLYDPQQNVNVCFTGQLLILALANEMYENTSADIYQVNTDGIVLEFDETDAKKIKFYIRKWEKITGLKFDVTLVSRLWQHNVNNYIMETSSGKIKVKGRWLDPTLNPFNNLFFRVVKKAVFDYLVRGTPIDATIKNEKNPLMFLYTVKTGGTYDGTVLATPNGEIMLGKVNRIYASTDKVNGGTFYKQKGQSRGLVPDCPQVAKTYNTEVVDIPSDLDYQWYIDKAQKMLDSLIRKEL